MTALVVLAAGRARRYGGVKPLAAIGVEGEAVIDLLAGDAVRAGFDRLVLVINPDTGTLIRNHVTSRWPAEVEVEFAVQRRPRGTVDAVMAARDAADDGSAFAIANADDLYGVDALGVLGSHLADEASNALVGFRIDRALVGELPVTRGVCTVADGLLAAVAERRHVTHVDGEFRSGDGLEPEVLDPASLVSMNLWGFDAGMWALLEAAMAEAWDASEENEVLLPVIVSRLIGGDDGLAAPEELRRFRVLETTSRCVGVTHPDDLELVRAVIAEQVATGERPAAAFPD